MQLLLGCSAPTPEAVWVRLARILLDVSKTARRFLYPFFVIVVQLRAAARQLLETSEKERKIRIR